MHIQKIKNPHMFYHSCKFTLHPRHWFLHVKTYASVFQMLIPATLCWRKRAPSPLLPGTLWYGNSGMPEMHSGVVKFVSSVWNAFQELYSKFPIYMWLDGLNELYSLPDSPSITAPAKASSQRNIPLPMNDWSTID